MSVNDLLIEIEDLIKEHSKAYNNGEISYAYVAGYFVSLTKNLAVGLNPKKILEEEIEHLKRKNK